MQHAKASLQPIKADPQWRIGIIASSFYKEEIDALVQAAIDTLMDAGIPESHILRYDAPGSFEVPLIGHWLAEAKSVDAMLGFGIIVQGQTQHADLIAREAARGIMDVQLAYGIPFAFEILSVSDLSQARERCFGPQSKGIEAAHAALHSLAEKRRIRL